MDGLIIHNSFNLFFRNPFGAVCCCQKINISIFTETNSHCTLLVWYFDHYEECSMFSEFCSYNGTNGYIHSYNLTAPDKPGLVFYCFKIENSSETAYYCGRHGNGYVSYQITESYQITVYLGSGFAENQKNRIAYQIFPDRFKRGNKYGGLLRINSHTNRGQNVFIHTDWNDEVLYNPKPYEKYYTPNDFYCGDLQGIEQSIDYLKSLSVNMIYLNPIFESASNHRYDTADYMHIDGILGGDDAFYSLQNACKANKIELMLDGVFSHTGADSLYFNKYKHYGEGGAFNSKLSPYYEWYSFIDHPDTYNSWWGFDELPEVNEDCPSYQRYIENVLNKWRCSWRLDVADELTDNFMQFLYEKTKAIDKNSIVIGEVWEDASDKHSKNHRRGYTNGNMLDGVMNYPLRTWIINFLTCKIDARELAFNITAQAENYPRNFLNCCLNLLSSHDTQRILTVLCGAPDRDALPKDQQQKVLFSGKRLTNGIKKVILAILLQFSVIGIPCIYYGDEVGMQGMADPFSRRAFMQTNNTNDLQLLTVIQKIAFARSKNTAFCGDMICTSYGSEVAVIARINDSAIALCLVNRSADNIKIDIDITADYKIDSYSHKSFKDCIKGKIYTVNGNILSIILDAYSGLLLEGL